MSIREREALVTRQRAAARRRRLEFEAWENARSQGDRAHTHRPRHEAGADGARPLEEWTRDELYAKAKELGIDRRSAMSKRELMHALRVH